jgi:bifunctional enzyme CysN/CysC
MSEEAMQVDRNYYIKHTTKTVSGVISQLRFEVDVNTLHRSESEGLGLNEIGRCVLTLSQPIAYDPYSRNRATGAFIIIDRITNNTVGAGMILDRDQNLLQPTERKLEAKPKSEHIHLQKSMVTAKEREQLVGHKPKTIWLTGLTGAGKTTIAYALERKLFDAGQQCFVLDGENVRLGFSKDLGFSADDRNENIRRAAEVAKLLNDAGLTAICAFLSPYKEGRKLARKIVGEDDFVEVYLSAPIDECKKRNQDGKYDMARDGEIKQFTGVTAPYEIPESPDIVLPTHQMSVDECVEMIIARPQ